LLAEFLRRRNVPYKKVFCWLRREDGVFKTSPPDAPGTRLVELTFPFAAYEAPAADRLAVFADWLVNAIALGAPELGIDGEEVEALKQRLAEHNYTYVRTDKLKRAHGEPACLAVYAHAPTELTVTVKCKLPKGETISRTLDKHPFLRDELAYGRAISRVVVGQDRQLTAYSYDGALLS
jgi:hypothetical protein